MTPVRSEMPATVVEVSVSEGQHIDRGAQLVVLESMKMEIPVASPVGGKVSRVVVAAGDLVEAGDVLVEIEPALP
ncbi:MAG: biotinylated protein TB7.3 [Acidimicrobiia bacterium]|nr:MAG: biotinylated protein TB7.3 [Acidimicrobiia bacterium]